jgi:hypothetical protein
MPDNKAVHDVTRKTIAVERFIAAALAFVGFREAKNNRGQVVERFLKATGLPPGYAWCAALTRPWLYTSS